VRVGIAQKRKISVGDKMAGRHGNKGVISTILPLEDMPFLPDGTPVEIILNPIGVPSRMNVGQLLETHLGWAAYNLGLKVMTPVFDGATETEIEDAMARIWLLNKFVPVPGANGHTGQRELKEQQEHQARLWLRDHGFDPEPVFDERQVGEAKRVSLRLWLQEMGIDTSGMDDSQVEGEAERVCHDRNEAIPVSGKINLRDGRTGELFNQPVTVGFIYMMKLVHLVEDKVHARSTGPYSLITQQPLGGKAQFGGQRFGEMEVWALEAYGAAHILQEILTVKSDDVVGRVKAYEAIVKGGSILEPGVPESFKVLVKELQSLGLSIEVLNEEHESIPFVDQNASGDDSTPYLDGIDLEHLEKA
jgi:DNA-directed RNA polymerase subunit beta